MGRHWGLPAAVCAALLLAGCVAAIPAVMMASTAAVVGGTAFGIYKVVQLESGGGKVEVGFQRPLPEGGPREAARSLRRIAVWPTSNENAYLAERLARQPALTVISPTRIRELMADRKEVLSLKGLLESERAELFRLACRRAAVDAVYFAEATGQGYDANTFSLDQPKVTYGFQHGLYDCQGRAFRLLEAGQVQIAVGGAMPASGEVERAANGVVAERLIEFIGA